MSTVFLSIRTVGLIIAPLYGAAMVGAAAGSAVHPVVGWTLGFLALVLFSGIGNALTQWTRPLYLRP